MLISEEFAFLHFPKAAGTTIKAAIRAHFPVQAGSNHAPGACNADLLGDRLVMDSVRHPYTWYEARIRYSQQQGKRLPFHGFDVGEMPPDQFIALTDDDQFLVEHAEVIWRRPEFFLQPFKIMRRLGIGFFTFEFLTTFSRTTQFASTEACTLGVLEQDLMPSIWIPAEAPLPYLAGALSTAKLIDPTTSTGRSAHESILATASRNIGKTRGTPISEKSRAIIARRDAALLDRFYGPDAPFSDLAG